MAVFVRFFLFILLSTYSYSSLASTTTIKDLHGTLEIRAEMQNNHRENLLYFLRSSKEIYALNM